VSVHGLANSAAAAAAAAGGGNGVSVGSLGTAQQQQQLGDTINMAAAMCWAQLGGLLMLHLCTCMEPLSLLGCRCLMPLILRLFG
jgi:hypothetical protein